jgi:hypothetical protein
VHFFKGDATMETDCAKLASRRKSAKCVPRSNIASLLEALGKHRTQRRNLVQAVFNVATSFFSFVALGTAASAKSPPTLCAANEKTIFSCRFPDQKKVSVCSVKSSLGAPMRLRYRFGKTAARPELVFPANDAAAGDQFWFYAGEALAAPHKGWTGPSRQLGFESGGHTYALEIYSNRGTGEHYANLVTKSGSGSGAKVVSDRTCELKNAINRSYELEKLGLPNRLP